MQQLRAEIGPAFTTLKWDHALQEPMWDLVKRFSHSVKTFGKRLRKPERVYLLTRAGKVRTGLLWLVLTRWLKANPDISVKLCIDRTEFDSVTKISEVNAKLSLLFRHASGLYVNPDLRFGRKSKGAHIEHTGRLRIEYRDYLVKASEVFQKTPRGIWACATNSGKGRMSAALTERFPRARILLTVPSQRSQLAVQGHDVFRDVGVDSVGLVKGGDLSDARVVWASTATLLSRLKGKHAGYTKSWLRSFDLVIKDECHDHSKKEDEIYDMCSAWARLGMSGTPFKGDSIYDGNTMGTFGPAIYTISNSFLVKRGYSAEPFVYQLRLTHPTGVNTFSTYPEWEGYIYAADWRNRLVGRIAKLLHFLGHRVVVTTSRINPHATTLTRILDKAGGAEMYSGRLKVDERSAMLRRFARGRTRYLVASRIFDVGVSEDSITAIIIAGPIGKQMAKITSLQKAGRGLRTGKSKHRKLVIVDIQDMTVRFGTNQALARSRVWAKDDAFKTHTAANFKELKALLKGGEGV